MSEPEFHSSNDAHGGDESVLVSADITTIPLDQLEVVAMNPVGALRDDQAWEGLRELSVARMRCVDLDSSVRRRWGRLALAAIAKKTTRTLDDSLRRGVEVAYVRAAMIKCIGVDPGDPDLDPEGLFQDCLEIIGTPYSEVSSAASRWRSLPPTQMLRLRRIKNMLSALKEVEDEIAVDSRIKSDVGRWLALIPTLP